MTKKQAPPRSGDARYWAANILQANYYPMIRLLLMQIVFYWALYVFYNAPQELAMVYPNPSPRGYQRIEADVLLNYLDAMKAVLYIATAVITPWNRRLLHFV